jgi:hypothetical protein
MELRGQLHAPALYPYKITPLSTEEESRWTPTYILGVKNTEVSPYPYRPCRSIVTIPARLHSLPRHEILNGKIYLFLLYSVML